MGRALLFAFLFSVVGLFLFALAAPLLFPSGSDFVKIGKTACPIILLVCGGSGFALGLRKKK